MKKESHPPYQDVLFVDSSTGHKFVCGTTLRPKETETFEGKEYPVCRLSISSSSHPFFNKNKQQFLDTEGRVDRFTKRYAAKRQVVAKTVEAQVKQTTEKKGKRKQ